MNQQVVTELAVMGLPDGRATQLERAPGVTVGQVIAGDRSEVAFPDEIPEMRI